MCSVRSTLAAVVLTGSLLPSAPAQQDAAPVNAEAILRALDEIEAKQQRDLESARHSAISQIQAAANSPSAAKALYQKAVEAIQFAGVKGKGAAFADWKSSMSDVLRSKDLQTALMLHLQYLTLSLERGGSEEAEKFVAPSLNYVMELAGADKDFLEQDQRIKTGEAKDPSEKQVAKLRGELLNKALSESPFVKWLRIATWLPKGGEWELVPGRIAGILEKNIRVQMRKSRDPKLVQTWEIEMKVEAARATAGERDHDASEYNLVEGPRLRFSRARDMVLLDQKNRGVSEIYELVKTYPQHPDFGKWVQELRTQLSATPAAPAAP